jgi:hypothetical protein
VIRPSARGGPARLPDGHRAASPRTIIKALASADPPERKKIHREPAALNGLNGHIDAIIEADPKVATATIWQRIADEHGTTVAYYALRTYVASHRASGKTPGQSQRRDR